MPARLIIAADLHGFYSSWQELKSLLCPEDELAIAGDLFDTKYGHRDNTDFQPDKIKSEFINLKNKTHYVYGNCDQSHFFPNQEYFLEFEFAGKRVLLQHGHIQHSQLNNFDIVIEGHSHHKKLQKIGNTIFLNPGSFAQPRDGVASFSILEDNTIKLIERGNDNVMADMNI